MPGQPTGGGAPPSPSREEGVTVRAGGDGDQADSRADQTSSDADQTSSDADQTRSDADQAASDRDQAASDRELAAHPHDVARTAAHAEGRARREATSLDRDETTLGRSETSAERIGEGVDRDETAVRRDLAATARDRRAAALDRDAEEVERALGSRSPDFLAAIDYAAEVRARAAADRARAAADREQAARDRGQAAEERKRALAELRRSDTDDLTGALRRRAGEAALRGELDRARRTGDNLVLAFVDLDGLKETNDRRGHAAGDLSIRAAVSAMRSMIRSYEPIVRFGGDEFLCSFAGIDMKSAEARFGEIEAALGTAADPVSISVGLAELRHGDTLEDLISRADAALLQKRAARQGRRQLT